MLLNIIINFFVLLFSASLLFVSFSLIKKNPNIIHLFTVLIRITYRTQLIYICDRTQRYNSWSIQNWEKHSKIWWEKKIKEIIKFFFFIVAILRSNFKSMVAASQADIKPVILPSAPRPHQAPKPKPSPPKPSKVDIEVPVDLSKTSNEAPKTDADCPPGSRSS